MTIDKLVDSTQLDSDLTDVADEIRTAGGTLLPLSFPDDYVVAIGDIGNTEIKTASGSIAHFEDALARKAQDLTVAIEPVQDLHGYDNPWPAGGGKNKCYDNVSHLFPRGDGLTIVTDAETLTAYAKVPKNTDCVFSCSGGQNRNMVYGFEQEPAVGVVCHALQRTQLTPTSHLFNSGEYEYVGYYYGTIPTTNVMIELGSTATAYSPYSNICPISGWTGANIHVSPTTDAADGTTYSITFPTEAGTVYGGTLDVTTGKLTVDRAMVDLGTLTWYTVTAKGHTRFRALVSGVKHIALPNILASLMCSYYQTKTANETYNGTLGISLQQNCDDVYIYDPQMETMSATDFKTAMSGVQLVYELATPIVYDLTPTEVTTLLGTNNVWADTGDSTIKYIAPKAQIPSAQGVYF